MNATMGLYTRIVDRSTTSGIVLIALGVVLLLTLRFWASPLARSITGREPAGYVDFLGIPLFFVVVGAGIALFLWEPERE